MALKLIKIIQKNFKLLIRSKSSALIVLLGPLLLILLVGLAFSNTSSYILDIGVYSSTYTQLTNDVMAKLSEQQYKVTKYSSEQECIQAVKEGDSNICIIFPPDFEIKPDTTNEIVFNVDYSKVNIVFMVLDVISSKISSKSEEISKDLTSTLLDKLKETETVLQEKTTTVVELTSENAQMSKKIDSISSSLGGMKLSLNTSEFKINDIEVQAGKLQNVKDDALDAIDIALSALDDIEEVVNNSAVNTITSDAKLDLNEIKGEIENSTGNTSSSLGTLVSNLKSRLAQTEEDIIEAGEARDSNINNLNSVKSTLSSSLNKLNILQASMDKLLKSIQSIEITSAEKIVSPIKTKIQPITVEKTPFNYLFPTLIVLVIMITSILLSSTLVMVEKKSKAFFRNHLTPTRDTSFIFATYFTALILIVLQLTIFLIVAGSLFKTELLASITTTIAVLFLVSTFFIVFGMLIGSVFKSEETTTLAAITAASIFLFFSSVVLPLESMPFIFKKIAMFNPFVISETLLRQSIFFLFGFKELLFDLLMIAGYIVAAFLLVWLVQKMLRIHLLYHMHKASRMHKAKKREEDLKNMAKEGSSKPSKKGTESSKKKDEIKEKIEKLQKELDDFK